MPDLIDVFLEELSAAISDINVVTNDSEGAYGNEWLTTDAVSSMFTNTAKIIETANNSIDIVNNYLSDLERAEMEIPTPLLEDTYLNNFNTKDPTLLAAKIPSSSTSSSTPPSTPGGQSANIKKENSELPLSDKQKETLEADDKKSEAPKTLTDIMAYDLDEEIEKRNQIYRRGWENMNTDYYDYYSSYESIHAKSKMAAENAELHPMSKHLGKDLIHMVGTLTKYNIGLSLSGDEVYTTFAANMRALANTANNMYNYASSIYSVAEKKYVTLNSNLDKLKNLDVILKEKCAHPPLPPNEDNYEYNSDFEAAFAEYIREKKAWEYGVIFLKTSCQNCVAEIDSDIEYLSKVNSCDNSVPIQVQKMHVSSPSNPNGIDYNAIKDAGYTPQGYTLVTHTGTPLNNVLLITAYKKGENSKIYIYDAGTGKLDGEIILTNKDHVGGVTYDPDNRILWVTGSDGQAHSYDFAEMVRIYEKNNDAKVSKLEIDFNDEHMLKNNKLEIPNTICTKGETGVMGGYSKYMVTYINSKFPDIEYEAWEDGMDTITYHKGRLYSGSYSSEGILFETKYEMKIDERGNKYIDISESKPVCNDLHGAVQGIAFYEDERGEYLITCSSSALNKSRLSKYPVIRNGDEVSIDNTRGNNNFYIDQSGAEGISIDSAGNISTVFEYEAPIVSTVCNVADITQPPNKVSDMGTELKGDYWNFGHGEPTHEE